MSHNKFLKGTVIGALLGSVAALLLAPKSGKETQDDLRRKAKGVKRDVDTRVNTMVDDLTGRISSLKEAARDLKGEAKEESQDLVKRAERLKEDLRASAMNLSKAGGQVKEEVVTDARRLIDEGAGIMSELERLTKTMAASTRQKVKGDTEQKKLPKPEDDNQA